MPLDLVHSPVALRDSTLARVPDAVPRPRYDRRMTWPRLVHIGVGGFNRSHLAVYLDDLLSSPQSEHWGEFGIGLLPPDEQIHAALAGQDYLYGVMELDTDRRTYRVIGSLTGHLYAPADPAAVVDRLSAPECTIISLTVTEGGYFIEDATGRFMADHPDIQHDREHPASPRTWVGFVAEAARHRMRSGHGPFTLLSCDNLPGNGHAARNALLSFAEAPDLRKWIEANVSFPNSMVDRITPKTTEEDRARIAQDFGVIDQSPVVCESFRQWVLEDAFIAGRPAWDLAGAQITTDVAPYEKTKMRILNGGHSAIGYAADLLGYATIADAVSDPMVRELLIRFMAEVRRTLKALPGIDLDSYAETIVKRFANPAIRDQVARICSDGSAKMAKFIVPSLRDLLGAGMRPRMIPHVLAAWLHYLAAHDADRPATIQDKSLDLLRPFLAAGGCDARLALETRTLFGDVAAAHPHLVSDVQQSLSALRLRGARAWIAEVVSGDPR